MDTETILEQREQREQWPEAALPPRGRPFVKGQSGNPAGRPSRGYKAAYVAGALIAKKTVPLTNKLIDLALRGDHAALRMCLDRITPTLPRGAGLARPAAADEPGRPRQRNRRADR